MAGLVGRRAHLFRTASHDAADQFALYASAHPSAFGLRGDVDRAALSFETFSVSQHGPLFLIRLTQKYRGLPILGPEGTLVLSGRGTEVTLTNGTVTDGALPYANLEARCSEELAARALREHAAEHRGDASQIQLDGPHLSAMPHAQRLVWAAHASRNGAHLGHFAVDAAPTVGDELPPLVYMDRDVNAGLEDEVHIKLRSVDSRRRPTQRTRISRP